MDYVVGWMHPENLAPTGVRTPDRPPLAFRYLRGASSSVKDLLTS